MDTPAVRNSLQRLYCVNLSGAFRAKETPCAKNTLDEIHPKGAPSAIGRASGGLRGRPVPPSIFAENHLGYVTSTPDNLRSYLQEALSIDGTFLNLFTFDDWTAALELTLHYRPPDIPTEHYLKSQNLWIMHKLLLRKGLRDPIQAVLQHCYEQRCKETYGLRAELGRILDAGKEFMSATPPSSTAHILGTLHLHLAQFQEANQAILRAEAEQFTADRCQIIRWFSKVMCQPGGEQWLKQATLEDLEGALRAPLNPL